MFISTAKNIHGVPKTRRPLTICSHHTIWQGSNCRNVREATCSFYPKRPDGKNIHRSKIFLDTKPDISSLIFPNMWLPNKIFLSVIFPKWVGSIKSVVFIINFIIYFQVTKRWFPARDTGLACFNFSLFKTWILHKKYLAIFLC